MKKLFLVILLIMIGCTGPAEREALIEETRPNCVIIRQVDKGNSPVYVLECEKFIEIVAWNVTETSIDVSVTVSYQELCEEGVKTKCPPCPSSVERNWKD